MDAGLERLKKEGKLPKKPKSRKPCKPYPAQKKVPHSTGQTPRYTERKCNSSLSSPEDGEDYAMPPIEELP